MNAELRTLWPEIKAHRGQLIIVILLGVFISGLKALVPELFGQLTEVWAGKDNIRFYQLPILISSIWIVSAIARYFHMFIMQYVAEQIALNLRRNLMNKYLSLNLSFHQNFVTGSGGLISRMMNDIFVIQNGFQKIADAVREPFLIIFIFGYLLYVDWKLTLFAMIGVPAFSIITKRIAMSIRKYSKLNQEAMERVSQTIKESLDGTRIVQSFNLQPEMRRRFEEEASEFLETRKKILSREESAGPISESLAALLICGIFIYVGFQIREGSITMATFMSFSFAIGLMQDSVKKVQGAFIKIQQSSVALGRLRIILDDTDEITDPVHAMPFPNDWKAIEFNDVSFQYDQEKVLDHVQLKIHRGEKIAFVGTSGSGKSTLMNLLPRFFDPTHGTIRIDNVDLRDIKVSELRSNVALVTQDVFLFSDTVARNIQSGDFSKSKEGVEAAAKLANAHTFISTQGRGYDARVGDRGNLFSGGEKQRISIARAIFKDAPILILDEATSALDSQSELDVQRGLEQLMKGRTALIIAHRLSTIRDCDRIVVMEKGRVLEIGSHQQLLDKNGPYAKFCQLQNTLA